MATIARKAAFAPATSRRSVKVSAAFTKVATKSEVTAAGGKLVKEVAGQKVLLVESAGQIYAMSNKCPHIGLSLQGKTPILQAKVEGNSITCNAHNTKFDMCTGEVVGQWCPKLPEALANGFGMTTKKPLPIFKSRVTEAGAIEVEL